MSADELCETAFGGGSIGSFSSTHCRNESARQKCRDEIAKKTNCFTADRKFVHTCAFFGIHYETSGIADGIEKDGKKVTVYMINTVGAKEFGMPPSKIFSEKANCIAYFACSEFGIENVKLCTVICNSESGKFRKITSDKTAAELLRSFNICLSKVERYAKICVAKEEGGRDTITAMKFPFSHRRPGQKELIEEVYRAIHDERRLFVQAPTGIGKTMSVLYPSVKAIGAGLCDKIFYLTAKSSTRREALSAARKMFDEGAKIKVIALSSKEQMCASKSFSLLGKGAQNPCLPSNCAFSRGYYDRVGDAVYELLSSHDGYTSVLIKEVAAKYNICPYELSLDLSEHCDIIICDYNYIFDPHVYLKRYFDDDGSRRDDNLVFLIDEAHNLADRARGMYSAELNLSDFEKIYSSLPITESKLSSELEEIMRAFHGLKRLCADNMTEDLHGNKHGFYFSASLISGFSEKLNKFLGAADKWRKNNRDAPVSDILGELLFSIKSYVSMLDFYDEHFRSYVSVDEKKIKTKIYCIDPSDVLDTRMNRAVSSILFSATLTPTDYFIDLLGGSRKSEKLELPSPFQAENLCLVAFTGVSVRQSVRDLNASVTATGIAAAIAQKKGNYLVYFPSYAYMDTVARIFIKQFPNVKTIIQSRGMSYTEKEKFLSFFKNDEGVMRVGFCVLGGSFSEGVDLPGSRLIGSIVIGVGLPQLSTELNIMRDFYDLKYEPGYGYAYAYTYPGMNKILQACGRVIRCETDRGIVVLIDDRYGLPEYRALFPEHWQNIKFASSASELANVIKKFWGNENNM